MSDEPTVIPGTIVNWLVVPSTTTVPQELQSLDSGIVPSERLHSAVVPQHGQSTKERPLRPQVVAGFTTRYRYGEYGSVYVTMNYDIVTNALIEIFITSSQTSARNQAYTNVLARMISNQVKHGVPLNTIFKHMIGMDEGQASFVHFPGQKKPLMIKSIPDLIGNILRLFPTYDHLESVVYEEAGLNEVDEHEEGSEPVQDTRGLTFGEFKEHLMETAEEQGVDLSYLDDVGTAACDFNNSQDCPDSDWVNEGGCYTCRTCSYAKCG